MLRRPIGLTLLVMMVGLSAVAEPLSLRVEGEVVHLANGRVALELDKASGQLRRLRFAGQELLGRQGRGYVQGNDHNGYLSPSRNEFLVTRDDDEVIDVGFRHQHRFAVDFEMHYALRPGEAGFHVYFIYGSGDGWQRGARLRQLNYALRVDPALFTHFFDGANHGELPPPASIAEGEQVMDATFRLADGTVYTKYAHAAMMDERHLLHGLAGDRFGVWTLMPTHEYLNGAPFHAELTVHQTNKTPILLRHVQAAHFGAGDAAYDGTSWEKWGGPWFHYVNAGGTMAERQRDAAAMAEKLRDAWPYEWLKDPRFARERGRVTGRLLDADGKAIAGARVVLVKAASDEGVGVQQGWHGYRFFGWTEADGAFDLEKVWPDDYRLHASQTDVSGSFRSAAIRVEAGKTVVLGEQKWKQPPLGAVLWQIGTLDRSAAEFGFAENFRDWGLWERIAEAHPSATISLDPKRQGARQLPMLFTAHARRRGGVYLPRLKLNFELAEKPEADDASLLLAVADAVATASSRVVGIKVEVNGEAVGELRFRHGGGTYRSGISGHFQQQELTFPAAKLRAGKNQVVLRLRPDRRLAMHVTGMPQAGLMWDALRLSVH